MSVESGVDVAKVLIVDDLPENLLALQGLLREESVVVYSATSGEDALSLLIEHEFALALIDVQMPGMTGFELAELIRGASRTRHLPIVFVSAADREPAYTFRGYDNGAVDFLYKPLDGHAVVSKVRVFAELYRRGRELRIQLQALEKARADQDRLLAELRVTQGELQRAMAMRDEFMSMVAHELRTPLSVMSLETALRQHRLKRGELTHFSPDRLNEMFVKDARQVRAMTRLIEDLLDISRIQSGRLSIRTRATDLGELAHRVVDDHREHYQNVPLELTCAEGVTGEWDDFRLEQVLANLLSNALRYGEGKPVNVTVQTDGARAKAILRVTDQGMGIPPEQHGKVFDRFVRLNGRDGIAGMGLGLYISRQFVDAHGGRIDVASEPGKGACFTVELPMRAAAAGAVPAQEVQPHDGASGLPLSGDA